MTVSPLGPATLEPVLDVSAFTPGRAFPPVGFVLDDALVDAYLAATGEADPLYARDGAGLAPPLLATLVRLVKASLGGRWPSGTVQLDHHVAMRRALRRGERLTIDAVVATLERRGERLVYEIASTVRDADGAAVIEQRSASLWAGATVKPAGATDAAGTPAPAPPRSPDAPRDGAPAPAPHAVPSIGPLTVAWDLAAVRAFGAVAGALDPIHVDPDYARGTRFGGNIVQGRLAMTACARLMLERLGRPWLERGTLSVRFVRPVRVGEPLHAWAAPDGADRFRVWCEDPRGTRTIDGVATLAAPTGGPGRDDTPPRGAAQETT